MIVQSQVPEFRLPGPCVELADQLGIQFGVPSYPLWPLFIQAIGAVTGVCLETEIWPKPVNTVLHLGMAVDDPEGMHVAVRHILEPILKFPDQKAKANVAGSAEPETMIISSAVPAQGLDLLTSPPAATLRNQLPTLLMENPKPGRLLHMAEGMLDGSLLAYYDDAGFVDLVEKARGRATKDVALLHSGWGKLSAVAASAAVVDPMVQANASCLALCRPPTLGRFLESRREWVRRLADQFIVMTVPTRSTEWQSDSIHLKRSFQAWSELVAQVAGACQSADKSLVQLSLEASKLLMDFFREETRSNAAQPAEQCGLAEYAALVAAKLALCFHLCVSGPNAQMSAQVMADAIGVARWLVRTSAKMKARLANTERDLVVGRNAKKMLELIPERSPVKWRKVCRRLHVQAKTFHEPTVKYLCSTGQIVRHADGWLERRLDFNPT